ncbi:YigZ family protein [Streptococcus sp. DD12]|uniref:YigZ family protein n=1 Tax=Streptococcus sp. DD12 TaxID=1777880 RepID=UPI00079AD684|nr:YigZ family protein [Streptococcus sp. DD12]KXT75962.1 hypothetical protein STRDD12_01074 [Streptococcus sp. DD12]
MTYFTIASDGSYEEEIKKSRFICYLKRITTEEEGRAFIATLKKQHHKASHACSAMIIGENADIKRSSDDGEPSGTAGVPMLTVLEKQELTNVVAVVVRYFGGIKLGAGGLIRAYSGSLAAGILALGRVMVTQQELLELSLSYSQYQNFESFAQQEEVTILDQTFSQDVQVTISLSPEREADFKQALTELYHGPIPITSVGKKEVEIPL